MSPSNQKRFAILNLHGAPLSARLCDWTVVLLCVWTISCHAALVIGGNLYHLIAIFGLLALSGLLWQYLNADKDRYEDKDASTPSDQGVSFPFVRLNKHTYWAFCSIAALVMGVVVWNDAVTSNSLSYWWGAVAVLATAWVVQQPGSDQSAVHGASEPPHSGESWLWLLAVFCAISSLFLHYPDPDDTFYISLSARAADSPGTPIMTQDPMFGIEGMPILNPAHVTQSHELFVAATSLLTGVEPVYIFHWGIAFVASLLVPFAYARLLKLLLPQYWLLAVIATLVVFVAAGDAHRWYGNFLVARLWVGKHILLMFFVPLVAYYAMAFVQRPTARAWLILAAAQIAGLGLSSTAIFVLPVVATLSSLVPNPFNRRGLGLVGLVMCSSAYVLVVAMILRSQMAFVNEYFEQTTGGLSLPGRYPVHQHWGDWLSVSFSLVFGKQTLLRYFAMLSIALAWMFYPRIPVARRFLILLPLGVLVTLLNPYLERLVVEYVTSSVHWRLFWIIPVPMIMALVLVSPAQLGRRGLAASGVLLAGYVLLIPEQTSFSVQNGVSIHAPTAKSGQRVTEAAKALNERVAPGSTVVAASPVSMVVPRFRDSAFPLVPWSHYLTYTLTYRNLLGNEERERRQRIDRLVSVNAQHIEAVDPRLAPLVEAEFAQALSDYSVSGVCIYRDSPLAEPLTNALAKSNFDREWHNEVFEVWIRNSR